jgi:hypothetical protein
MQMTADHGQQVANDTDWLAVRSAMKQGIILGVGGGISLGFNAFFNVLYRIPGEWSSTAALAVAGTAAVIALLGVTTCSGLMFAGIEWVLVLGSRAFGNARKVG